ncbi:hypothetical protein AB2C23_33315, partial [Pseudomonas aeruginosa]
GHSVEWSKQFWSESFSSAQFQNSEARKILEDIEAHLIDSAKLMEKVKSNLGAEVAKETMIAAVFYLGVPTGMSLTALSHFV